MHVGFVGMYLIASGDELYILVMMEFIGFKVNTIAMVNLLVELVSQA